MTHASGASLHQCISIPVRGFPKLTLRGHGGVGAAAAAALVGVRPGPGIGGGVAGKAVAVRQAAGRRPAVHAASDPGAQGSRLAKLQAPTGHLWSS